MEAKLLPSQLNSYYLEIWVNDQPFKVIHKQLYKKFLKSILASKNIQEEFEFLEKKVAYHYLLRLLSKRAYSSYELKKKLSERGVDPGAIDTALAQVSSFLNDSELESSIVRVMRARGKGDRAIVEKIVQRLGKSREEAKQLFCQSGSNEEQIVSGVKVLERKRVEIRDYQDRAKALRMLQMRGFSYPAAKEVLETYLEKQRAQLQ